MKIPWLRILIGVVLSPIILPVVAMAGVYAVIALIFITIGSSLDFVFTGKWDFSFLCELKRFLLKTMKG